MPEQELLKVLDLPEEEQNLWLVRQGLLFEGCSEENLDYAEQHQDQINRDMLKADAAFRLRRERKCMEHWWVGVLAVYRYVKADFIKVHRKLTPEVEDLGAAMQWFGNFAEPIHFIGATLIAKLEAKEQQ